MKAPLFALLIAVLVHSTAQAHQPQATRPPSATPVPGPNVPKVIGGTGSADDIARTKAKAALAKRMRTIILPEVVLDAVSVNTAAKILWDLNRRSDLQSPSSQRGVPILAEDLKEGEKENDPQTISYRATDVPLGDAVEGVAHLGHRYVKTSDYAVQLVKTPLDERITRTYLLPPFTAKQQAEMAHPRELSPADLEKQEAMRERAKALLTSSSAEFHGFDETAVYISSLHALRLMDTEANHQALQAKIEEAWREYYATHKKTNRKAR
ncbi:MAG: hypothetical protein ABJF10_23045 [Chthoniobacter sp.]|uniref:hypothetical protein n=1 Tax=Chthoniobacter sp. TaxID=2510640 RepID=UPI0032AB36D2